MTKRTNPTVGVKRDAYLVLKACKIVIGTDLKLFASDAIHEKWAAFRQSSLKKSGKKLKTYKRK